MLVTVRPAVLLVLAALLPACISPKSTDDGDSGGGDSGDSGGGDSGDSGGGDSGDSGPATIYDVNNGSIAVGEIVTLTRVVVTSEHTRDDEGFFIQDPAGGAQSGLYVWSYNGVYEIYATPGDEVTVTGTVSNYYDWIELTIDSSADVTITGAADVPEPVNLGDGSGVDWNDYESVPVRVLKQEVASVNEYGTGLLDPSGVNLDDGFGFHADVNARDTIGDLRGIVFYEYGEWSINPRDDDDVLDVVKAPPVESTIADIQQGNAGGSVVVTDVIASSASWDDDGDTYFFAQDAGGGMYSGLLVYVEGETLAVALGDELSIAGETNEFYGMTEIKVTDLDDITITGTGKVYSTLVSGEVSDWEPYEGCLITLENVTEACDDPADNYGECLTSSGLTLDNELYAYPWSDGILYESLTGLVNYAYSTWFLLPRGADDIVLAD